MQFYAKQKLIIYVKAGHAHFLKLSRTELSVSKITVDSLLFVDFLGKNKPNIQMYNENLHEHLIVFLCKLWQNLEKCNISKCMKIDTQEKRRNPQ